MGTKELLNWHKNKKLEGLDSRFLPPDKLNLVIGQQLPVLKHEIIGYSVAKTPILGFKIGSGGIRILLWSQMHGNESTTTRSLLDAIKFITSSNHLAKELNSKLTLYVIPMLNPDGSRMFTRVNIENVDLNRDAVNLSQPESRALRKIFLDVKPDFCFNLHDQRSIFGVGLSGCSATLSFLSPSANEERSITPSRLLAMRIISGIKDKLSDVIGSGIGRFSDEFNPNCVGDQFQMQNVPTILFEAGHFDLDYQRSITRDILFLAFIEALRVIADGTYSKFSVADYLSIPENTKSFADVHIYNAHLIKPGFPPNEVLRLYFEEQLKGAHIIQCPQLLNKELGSGQFAHKVLDAANKNDFDWIKSHSALSDYFE